MSQDLNFSFTLFGVWIKKFFLFECFLSYLRRGHSQSFLNASQLHSILTLLWASVVVQNNNVPKMLLLLLLSCVSCVRRCATSETAAHQASPSLGFSRQEHWSGLPFPPPMHGSEKWKWSRSVVSDSSNPMDCSPPGSSVYGIFQARVLEWGAIAFSERKHSHQEIKTTVAK